MGLVVCLLAALALLAPTSAIGFGYLSGFATQGSAAGQAVLASGIAVGADGTVYLSDYGNNRVDVFSPQGAFIRAFGKGVNPAGGDLCTAATGCKAGAETSAPGALHNPGGIEIGPGGELFVTDSFNNRISVFSTVGAFLRAFGKNVNPAGGNVCTAATGCQLGVADESAGSLDLPTGLDIDAGGSVYVIGRNNERLDVFSASGVFLEAFGKGVEPLGADVCTMATGCRRGTDTQGAGAISYSWDVAVSPEGEIAVGDSSNRRVEIFTSAGTFVRAFGSGVNPNTATTAVGVCTPSTGCRKGTESAAAGGFAITRGMAVTATGNLLVADTRNHRINEFAFDGTFIRAFGEGVIDGEAKFEVCTAATGCRVGIASTSQGSLANAYGTAVDCTGAIYATTVSVIGTPGPKMPVERFGEPGTGYPPCAAAAPPPGLVSPEAFVPQPGRARSARPTIEIELNKGSGTATLTVIVSEPGTLLLRGKEIRTVRKQAKRSGLYELLVVAKGEAGRNLSEAGKATVKLLLTFRPKDGTASTLTKVVKLKRLAKF